VAANTRPVSESPCVIKVVGVGGAGGNAVNRMFDSNIHGVEFWSINTDAQALAKAKNRDNVLCIGRGLGAGGQPAVGAKAASEARQEIAELVKGSDLVFITAGSTVSALSLSLSPCMNTIRDILSFCHHCRHGWRHW
jgi:cell division GTPase FtsZ